MRKYLIPLLLFIISMQSVAAGPKDCTELFNEISDKISKNGVIDYSLYVWPVEQTTTTGEVVGTCENGTKKIVYHKFPLFGTP